MIAPEDCESAVERLRFVVALVRESRSQLTAVEIAVNRGGFVIYFFAHTTANLQDGHALVAPGFVNDVMDAWNLKEAERPGPPTASLPVSFERCQPEAAELSGCSHWVRVAIPAAVPLGPRFYSVAWTHALEPLPNSVLFVPTMNETLTSWSADIAVLGSRDTRHGALPKRPIVAVAQEDLIPMEEAFLIRQYNAALPFHNLYFGLDARPATNRDYLGASGARLTDATANRLVSFCDVGFQTVPVVCGCYVRDSLNFSRAHIPLTIPERTTRERPLVFRDGPHSVVFEVPGGHSITVDLLEREEFGGVIWVTARKS